MNRYHFATSGVIFVPHGTIMHAGYAFISETAYNLFISRRIDLYTNACTLFWKL